MAAVDSLPPELLSRVFASLPPGLDKRRTLTQASLVCRFWRDPAQRALHLDVFFSHTWERDAEELSLWLAGDARQRYRLRSIDRLPWDVSSDVLLACGGIRSLVVASTTSEAILLGDWRWMTHSNLSGQSRAVRIRRRETVG